MPLAPGYLASVFQSIEGPPIDRRIPEIWLRRLYGDMPVDSAAMPFALYARAEEKFMYRLLTIYAPVLDHRSASGECEAIWGFADAENARLAHQMVVSTGFANVYLFSDVELSYLLGNEFMKPTE